MKPKPFTVILHMDSGRMLYRVHGPGIDPDKWAYSARDSAEAMCNVFNSIASAVRFDLAQRLTKGTK